MGDSAPKSASHAYGYLSNSIQVLQNDELLRLVFDCATLNIGRRGQKPSSRSVQKEFSSYNLVCKTFSEVASDYIWEELDSTIPLIKLLPSVVLRNNTYSLKAQITESELSESRWPHYAKRVRAICLRDLHDDDPIRVAPQVYAALAALQALPRFPSLYRIRWEREIKAEDVSCLLLLLSSSVTDFALARGASKTHEDVMMSIIGQFVMQSPNLQQLHFDMTGRGTLALVPLDKLAQLRGLTSLKLYLPYQSNSIDSLSTLTDQLPQLSKYQLVLTSKHNNRHSAVKFSVTIPCTWYWNIRASNESSDMGNVMLSGSTSDVGTWLSRHSTKMRIQMFDIRILKAGNWDQIVRHILSTRQLSLDLKGLSIHSHITPISASSLIRLASLDRLSHLTLDVACSPPIATSDAADDFIRDLLVPAQSKLQPLQELSLLSEGRLWSQAYPTFKTLQHASIYAKDLQCLQIPLDSYKKNMPKVPLPIGYWLPPSEMTASPTSRCALKRLGVHDRRREDFKMIELVPIAILLDELFPDLEKTEVQPNLAIPDPLAVHEGWSIIEELRLGYQSRRRSHIAALNFTVL
ncbi:hypothetical protein FA15DRAFT_665440 [Coprinopsis marcescibilis]|uniref:F-box domain-containing protein n=1 Tax=Coprinopsis marcescibilis TaxID=230819 RepID=A0A5C3L6D1_COPMA|nr:hypothetical protein FA15DRAFT_665440 [Coprinopsis marcescibilis]